MDAGFIVHHIKVIGKQVNKPVTNTTRCTLKIATQEQLLWHRPSWTLPLLWHSSLLVYCDRLSSRVRNVFTCAPFCLTGVDFKIKTVELRGKKIRLQIWWVEEGFLVLFFESMAPLMSHPVCTIRCIKTEWVVHLCLLPSATATRWPW